MRYSTVLFDLDGTILDTSKGMLLAIDETISKCGLSEISQEQKRSMIGPPINWSLREIYRMTEEQVAEAAAIFRKAYSEKYLFEAAPYPGVKELLRGLRENGFKTGIATYKRNDYAQRLIEKMGVKSLCHFSLGSDGKSQTKADIIDLCLKALNCIPESCIMVGDTIHDLTGVRDVGMAFVGVTYGFGFRTREEIESQGGIAASESAAELKTVLKTLGLRYGFS